MHVRDILKREDIRAVTVAPDDSLAEVARRMGAQRKGLAVVCEPDGRLCGVVTAMDTVRALGRHEERTPKLQARDLMNADIVVCAPEDSIEHALGLMHEHRIRHLPVVEGDVLKGVVNLRDLLQCRCEESEMDAEEMRRYVFGAGYH